MALATESIASFAEFSAPGSFAETTELSTKRTQLNRLKIQNDKHLREMLSRGIHMLQSVFWTNEISRWINQATLANGCVRRITHSARS
jgi:hypothetical protein